MNIYDQLGFLSVSDQSLLRSMQWPFTVHLYIGSASSPDALSNRVEGFMSPNSVGIGLDPAHHFVTVRASDDSQIPAHLLSEIRKAGNQFFRNEDFVGGVNAILSAAREARVEVRHEAPPVTTPYTRTVPAVQHVERMAPTTADSGIGGGAIFAGLLFAAMAVFMFFVVRRNRKMQSQLEGSYRATYEAPRPPPVQPRVYMPPAPRYVPPAPEPVRMNRDVTLPYASKKREPTLSYAKKSRSDDRDNSNLVTGLAVGTALGAASSSPWDDEKKPSSNSHSSSSSWDDFSSSSSGSWGGGSDDSGSSGSSGSWD